MKGANPKVDFFFAKAGKWLEEFEMLRNIILDCGLTEELKWGVPCYTWRDSNILLIHGFKDYCAILFHKGVLLKDSDDLLVQQTKNVQSARQIRFTEVDQIKKLKPVLKAYIHEAIEVEKAGLEVKMKKTTDYEIPEEFQKKLDEMPALKKAFDELTPGRKRGYLLHFGGAKQSKTRSSRIEKSIPDILKGKGLGE